MFKHFPLSGHEIAPAAAQAAWCAGCQSKFWELHDRLFGFSGHLKGLDLEATSKEVGLDMAAYNRCRTGAEAEQAVRADRTEGDNLKVTGTPLFYFGRVRADRRVQVEQVLSGAKSVDAFKGVLDRLL